MIARRRAITPITVVSAGIAIDASTPAPGKATGVSSITSSAFSPPAGSLLVIVLGNSRNSLQFGSITDSLGTHLTYSRLVHDANSSAAEVWVADVPATHAGMTVTANVSGGTANVEMGVIVLTGAKATASQTGAIATSHSSPPSATLTLTGTGSRCIASTANNSTTTAPTIPAGQTDVFNGNTFVEPDTSFISGWWAWTTSANSGAGGGSVTLNVTGPSPSGVSMAMVEILAA